ncbi:MAG: ATP-binding protein [Pirellulales bacterium]|nr:ATP-binding protein [Pirellulales bacterium]
MARRPISRAVGATSLEIKCLFLFGVFLVVVMAFSLWLYWQVTEKVVFEQNPLTAGLLVDQALIDVHWVKLDTSDFKPFIAKMSQNMAETLNDKGVETTFLYRPDSPTYPASGPGRPVNDFERDLIARFMQPAPEDGKRQDWAEAFSPGNEKYYYYRAIRSNQSCTTLCHQGLPPRNVFASPLLNMAGVSDQKPADDELLAVAKITIPNERTMEAVNRYWGFLLGVAIITAFLAMIAFYIVIRYVIVRPLRHLRGVSDAIARGDINMRADIRTGDEFESLALAFNRMLRHLVDAQDELRRANVSLDVKVDELAKLNMQLYEMNRVKSDFMATMSHELRTPLNGILGFSDVLGSIDSLDAKQKRYVQNIQKSGRLLLEMVNNVLDLAKVESGKMELRLSSFDIGRVIGAQCDMARPLSERKNIDLVEQIEPDLPPMHQDQSRVQQILNNLLSNAIKFTPEGGRIKVIAARDGPGDLVLRVVDTGVGIAEEDQQVIFEKFRQGQAGMSGKDAMTREYGGSGLGLSIVRELCNLLGGDVSVESELGMGSTFTVRLPWEIEQQPLIDSPLTADFEEFGKSRFDRKHVRVASDDAETEA